MDTEAELQRHASRLDQLESQILGLRRQKLRLKWGLAIVAVLALVTPAVLCYLTSFGSELRTRVVVADRIELQNMGELVISDKPSEKTARLGFSLKDDSFGLVFSDRETEVIRLRADSFPSLVLRSNAEEKSQLRLGFPGKTGAFDGNLVGEPTVELVGFRGTRRASLHLMGNGEPHLALFDLDGKRKCVDVSVSSFFSKIELASPNETERKRRAELSSYPSLRYFDEKNQPLQVP